MESNGEVVWRGAERLRDHLVPIENLKPFAGNARRGDVQAIADSLQRFGQVRSIVVTEDGTIVAGHHVTKAAQLLRWTHVAAIPAEFDSRDDARDYLIADNQLASLGVMDDVDQMTLLEEIEARGSWEGTGFTADDLADMRALQVHRTQMVELSELWAHRGNYRGHPDSQMEHLTQSLREHGFYRNVVVARDGTILAGHGIAAAAQRIGLKKIPVTRLAIEPDSPEALKIIAGDNELAKLGEMDDRQLTEILRGVRDEVGLLGTGFDIETLTSLIMVTRPASEIQGVGAAAEWIGLPEYESPELPFKVVILCESEEDRRAFLETIGSPQAVANRLRTISIWWPEPRTREDELGNLMFDFEHEPEEVQP